MIYHSLLSELKLIIVTALLLNNGFNELCVIIRVWSKVTLIFDRHFFWSNILARDN